VLHHAESAGVQAICPPAAVGLSHLGMRQLQQKTLKERLRVQERGVWQVVRHYAALAKRAVFADDLDRQQLGFEVAREQGLLFNGFDDHEVYEQVSKVHE
jgi:hypothetical protein